MSVYPSNSAQLSATMLGDQQEKSKATLRTAIRRRKKTVTFAAPTYVDYSDIDYSTDEEDQEAIFAQQQLAAQQAREQAANSESKKEEDEASEVEDDSAKVQPLKTRSSKETKSTDSTKQGVEADPRPSSEDMFEGKPDGVSRSRNGTLRNTDSFFKDDSVETKKITLTPNLLRDDSTPRESTESKELRPRPSLDKLLEKDSPTKDDKKKKEKEKKPSAIRNFFSRKDRKNRGSADDEEGVGKRSMESEARDSRDDDADDAVYTDKNGSPQRHPSKLQKVQPRVEPSPPRKGGQKAEPTYVPETRNDVSNVPPATMRIVDDETQETIEVASSAKEEASRRSSMQLKPSPRISAQGDTIESPNKSSPQISEPEQLPESAAAPADAAGQPPPLVGDSSSQEEHSASPSPEIPDEEPKEKGWDDEKLRAFFDSGDDVRDMLVVVYDKTDVAPAGPEHPVVGGLFREQNAKLAEITTVSLLVSPPPSHLLFSLSAML